MRGENHELDSAAQAQGSERPWGREARCLVPLLGVVASSVRARLHHPPGLDGDGIIRHFAREVPPFDETLRCHHNVRWVLELAAGAARPLVEGDVVDLTLRAEQP